MTEENADPRISVEVHEAVSKWTTPKTESSEPSVINEDYNRYIFRKWVFMVACVVIVFIVLGVAVTIGSYDIKFLESYQLIWDRMTHSVSDADSTKAYIVVELRMPRIIVGIIAGAGLAVAGAVMQSTLMNPLADSYTTGVSSGASFGATVAMTMGITVASGSYAIIMNAFIFALIPTAMIIGVSKLKNASPTTMIMAGIAIMYVFNACTTVLMLWSDPNQLQEVYEWQVGTLSRNTWDEIPIMAVIVAICIVVVWILSRKLNVLATGDDTAKALGIDANMMRAVLLAIVSLMAAAVVSFTGLIGFVGLVVPHVVSLR